MVQTPFPAVLSACCSDHVQLIFPVHPLFDPNAPCSVWNMRHGGGRDGANPLPRQEWRLCGVKRHVLHMGRICGRVHSLASDDVGAVELRLRAVPPCVEMLASRLPGKYEVVWVPKQARPIQRHQMLLLLLRIFTALSLENSANSVEERRETAVFLGQHAGQGENSCRLL